MQRLTEENQKLYTNYDVLKEHELNIIKDFQDRKLHDQKNVDEQIAELRRQIEEKSEHLNNSRRQITDLENDVRKAEFETKKVLDQKAMVNEYQNVVQSKLDKEQADNKELKEKMAGLEAELDAEQEKCRNEAKEKKLAYAEIKQLQELVREMEETIQKLSGEIQDLQSQQSEKGNQISELEQQRKVFEERIELKQKEIHALGIKERNTQEDLDKLQSDYDKLDREMIKLKAKEFDKVDVLQLNAELEGRNKNLNIDAENLVKERNEVGKRLSEATIQNERLREQVRVLETELEYYRRTHEVQLDKFDKKFNEFQHELTALTDQNFHLKEKEKKYKRQLHDLEVQNLEWKEKFKYSSARNTDLTN